MDIAIHRIEMQKDKTAADSKSYKPQREDKVRKATYKEKKEYEQINTKLEELEKEKEDLMAKLNIPDMPIDKLQTMSSRFAEIENEIASLEDRWLELSEIV